MTDPEFDTDHPGIDRLHYFLGKAGMIASVVFVATVFGPTSGVMRVLGLLLMVASMVLDSMRLRNVGVSQWWAFIRFLPFGNTVLDLGLLCAQTGWAETRRLDRAGRSILIFELILIAMVLIVFLRMRMMAPFWL
jgi:uncharacterized membrane protein YhaH (DUF805 family)